ncbi:heme lyase CcmF/NrfE family subunit [Parvularcula maris]|uniref:heme lyase CcmF/NrfE family subunit n=1 Tax=Parvularcula maris TaxID=2965077 RepID=UPI002113B059|nr:heme lyase CcmF/NrfE family subunit [Parvularcula maris]
MGTFLLAVAAALGAAAAGLGLSPFARTSPRIVALSGAAMTAAFVTVASAFLFLLIAYAETDLSLLNVYLNSHSLKPLAYKLAGSWGNHEGSLLLWLLMLAGFGAAISLSPFGDLPTKRYAIGVQAMLLAAFGLFTVLTSNPFAPYPEAWPTPSDGRGLNPLLQDPGLAIHPPTLYLGYVGLSAVYSFTMAGLLTGRIGSAWAKAVRPYLLFAWSALTLGIGLGAYWAYYELGWGGFWFWDPVENASLMPWLAATALLHCVMVLERRDTLKLWGAALAILAFGASLLGAFLVRSGIVTSVHAFANDPERGVFLLLLSLLFIGAGFVLFALRGSKLQQTARFSPVSREGAIVVNNLLFAVVLFTVFLGTFWPIVMETQTGSRISVGPPYYNAMLAPLALLMAGTLLFGLLVPWKTGGSGQYRRPLLVAAGLSIAGALALTLATGRSALALAGFAAAFLVLAASLLDLLRKGGFGTAEGFKASRLQGVTARSWGALVSHLGLGLVLLGITASTVFQGEVRAVLTPGESTRLGALEIDYISRKQIAGPNYIAEQDLFRVMKNGRLLTELTPSRRYYPAANQATTEVAIERRGLSNLYLASAAGQGLGEARIVRAHSHPLIHVLWGGVLLLAGGGLTAGFAKRRERQRAAAGKLQERPA